MATLLTAGRRAKLRKFHIVRSGKAKSDIIDIWNSIAVHNRRAALRIVRRIDGRIRELGKFPELGPARPEIAPDVRMLVEGNYLILYRIAETNVEIIRVVHGARDLTTLI